MFPAFVRNRVIRVVVLALVGLLASPFAGADDYAFLHDGPADAFRSSAQALLGNPQDLNEEDPDESHDVCSCVACNVALGESFSPEVFSPQAGELLAGAAVRVRYASHLPDIYRPPIV
jgi:hypothetical protein